MPIKIAVCDDVAADRQSLLSMIQAEGYRYDCSSYESGEALLWDFEGSQHFDLFFLDIFMNGISGIDVAKRIRLTNPDALLIFVSSSNDFYRESYDLYAFNYLIKPLSQHKLSEVLQRATALLNKDAEQVLRFSFDNCLHVINCAELLYLSSDKHLVYFHLKNGNTLKTYGKIDGFVSQLPSKTFFRCHQSYVVNLKYVSSMTSIEFMLEEEKIPISRKFSLKAREKYRVQMFDEF